jgi:7-cyano-7-deazaguanine synthase in queuosine biosynthesis
MKFLPSFKLWFCLSPDDACHELVAGKHFHLGLDAIGSLFWANPSARLLDLLRIATSVYVVDRLAKRKRQSHERRWFRSLALTVAVREPDFWQRQEVFSTLMECLEFLSEDGWELKFVKDDQDQPPCERYLAGENPFLTNPPLVCLSSGGLDSVAGLAIRMAENPKRPVVPVTVRHQPTQKEIVQRQYGALRERFKTEIHPLVLKVALLWTSDLKDWRQEWSQRCRSFLFAAVGGVAAAMSQVAAVEVFESGVGAINLPLLAGMVGSRATRGSHPYFFRLMSRLVSLTAGREIVFHLPFLEKTKGEIVRQLAAVGLQELARSTVSCVHYPLRERPHKQCGVCPACIFRRQAMAVGGIEEPGVYKYDLFGPDGETNGVPEDRLDFLKAFLLQVTNLWALKSGSRVPERIRRHLFATNLCSSDESMAPFLHLLSRYRDEWLVIAAEGMDRDWAWTNLLAPIGAALIGEESHASA